MLTELLKKLPSTLVVQGPLGGGGQGQVLLGTFQNEPVAIKLYGMHTNARRVVREIELLERLNHPAIVSLKAHWCVEYLGADVFVLAFELHREGDLCKHFSGRTARLDEICRLGIDVASAIACLWNSRVVHRDIKPQNILVKTGGGFVLVDFGLVKHLELSDVTSPGARPGTFGYKSPEQAAGRGSLTFKSDIYSFGTTLYEVAVGSHPLRLGRGTLKPLQDFRPDLPPQLCRCIDQMMDSIPSRRPSDVLQVFEACKGGF